VHRCAKLDNLEFLLEGLRVEVVSVVVLHLGDTVEVPEAGVVLQGRGLLVVVGAIGVPTELHGVRCHHHVCTDFVREEALEYAPRLARLEVEDMLLYSVPLVENVSNFPYDLI
jgi:hypothetical protein